MHLSLSIAEHTKEHRTKNDQGKHWDQLGLSGGLSQSYLQLIRLGAQVLSRGCMGVCR